MAMNINSPLSDLSPKEVLLQHTDILVNALSQCIPRVTAACLAKGLISQDVADYSNTNNLDSVKASRLLTCVRTTIENDSSKFTAFIEVLRADRYLASTANVLLGFETTDSAVTNRELQVAFSEYKVGIAAAYDVMPIIESDPWPPVKEHVYVNLALIIPEQANSFSHTTVRSTVDNNYKKDFDAVFPPDKLSSEKHFVGLIQGRPGCGKSTFVTKMSKDWSDGAILKDKEIFVLVRLRRFVGTTDLSLKDILGAYSANSKVINLVHDKMTKESGKGVCFAFDGLDEYSANLTKNNIVMKIIRSHVLPLAAVFLTSRPATSEKVKLHTSAVINVEIEIFGFLEEDIKTYVYSYYRGVENGIGRANALMKYITDHPNVQGMCYLPLNTAIMVYLYNHDKLQLLKTETDLYYNFTIQTLYRSMLRDPKEDPDDIELDEFSDLPEDKEKIFRSVCKLAFVATVKQIQMFTEKEIKKLVEQPKEPQKTDYDSVGLLTVDGMIAGSATPTKTFSFLHLTHQEFLAAVHLVDHLSDSDQESAIQEHAGKDHMWVVWKFYCGLHAKNADNPNFRSDVYKDSFKHIIDKSKFKLPDVKDKGGDDIDKSKFKLPDDKDKGGDDGDKNVCSSLACLNMVHCAFESQFKQSPLDLLALLKGHIDVKDIALTPSDCSALGYVLALANKEITKIDFSYCHLGHDGIAAFVHQTKELDSFSKVDKLRLRARTDYKPVGMQGAYDLLELLEKLPNLGELRLYGNNIKTDRFKYLAPAIRRLRKLHTLILSRNDLKVGTGSMVSSALENLPLLHTFYISYNPLTEVGLGGMKPGLLKCEKLKILGLRDTGLGEGAGVHLYEILSTLTKLETLELYWNRIGDKGVADMAPGLLNAHSLQTLSLVQNEISDTGASALTDYLRTTNSLREMRIYYNHGMTNNGKIALRTAVVERSGHLNELKLAI